MVPFERATSHSHFGTSYIVIQRRVESLTWLITNTIMLAPPEALVTKYYSLPLLATPMTYVHRSNIFHDTITETVSGPVLFATLKSGRTVTFKYYDNDRAGSTVTTGSSFRNGNVVMVPQLNPEGIQLAPTPSSYTYFCNINETFMCIKAVFSPGTEDFTELFFSILLEHGGCGCQIREWKYQCQRLWDQVISDAFPNGVELFERPMPPLSPEDPKPRTRGSWVTITTGYFDEYYGFRKEVLNELFPKYREMMDSPDDRILRLPFSPAALKFLANYLDGKDLNENEVNWTKVGTLAEVIVLAEKCAIPYLARYGLWAIASSNLLGIRMCQVEKMQHQVRLTESPDAYPLKELAESLVGHVRHRYNYVQDSDSD